MTQASEIVPLIGSAADTDAGRAPDEICEKADDKDWTVKRSPSRAYSRRPRVRTPKGKSMSLTRAGAGRQAGETEIARGRTAKTAQAVRPPTRPDWMRAGKAAARQGLEASNGPTRRRAVEGERLAARGPAATTKPPPYRRTPTCKAGNKRRRPSRSADEPMEGPRPAHTDKRRASPARQGRKRKPGRRKPKVKRGPRRR